MSRRSRRPLSAGPSRTRSCSWSRDPALAIRLAEAMGEKLQEARDRIAEVAFRDVRGRVAHLVLTFLERERRLTGNDELDRIGPGLTHRELADIIGTRRESVTLALNALERDGLITVDDGRIIVRGSRRHQSSLKGLESEGQARLGESTLGEPYSMGVWIARAGREAEFVEAWREFAEWSLATIEGGRWARLLRDRAQANRFVSIGPWDSLERIEVWRSHPGFAERVGRIRELIESLEPSTLEVVVEVGEGA